MKSKQNTWNCLSEPCFLKHLPPCCPLISHVPLPNTIPAGIHRNWTVRSWDASYVHHWNWTLHQTTITSHLKKKMKTEWIWWSLKENLSWSHRSFKTNHLRSGAGEMNCMLLASILLHQDSIKLGSAGAIIHYLSTYPSKPGSGNLQEFSVTSNPTNSRQVHLGTSK